MTSNRSAAELGRGPSAAAPGWGERLVPPAGVRDFLYPESADRATLAAKLVEAFALYGYDLVITPPFEHAEVVERALEAGQRSELLRFVDPQSGEVAALRSDLTPQIARLVAANFGSRPAPWRLSYRGTVIRRRRGRARKHRQIIQAGVECIGVSDISADVEAIVLAARACDAARLTGYRVELNHVRVGTALLDALPSTLRSTALSALAQKDVAELQRALRGTALDPKLEAALLALPGCIGRAPDLARIAAPLRGTAAEPHVAELEGVLRALEAHGLHDALRVDLGELRGMSYYTGVSFAVLAEGPGEAIASGGRYDGLLARFGVDAPATGFAIDVTNLAWALEAAGAPWHAPRALRVAVAGDSATDACAALRAAGIHAAQLPRGDAAAFAAAWGYDAHAVATGAELAVRRSADGAERRAHFAIRANVEALGAWLGSGR